MNLRGIFNWAAHAISENMFTHTLSTVLQGFFKTPEGKQTTDKLMHVLFLGNESSDERLFVAAFTRNQHMNDTRRSLLLARLCALPTDQQDRFRVITVQSKIEKEKEIPDVVETERVLAGVADLSDADWQAFIDNMNLRNPQPVKGFVVWLKSRPEAIKTGTTKASAWLDQDINPQLEQLRDKLNNIRFD